MAEGHIKNEIIHEMAFICIESLDPGLEPLAGFRHGVPVQGAHQLLHLQDQVLNFVTVRMAGRPKLLLPHFREVLLMDLPVVPGDELLGACGYDGQNAVAEPLLPFFYF